MSELSGGDASARRSINIERMPHRFFIWFAVAAFLIVFAGFARTFFLKFLFATRVLPLYLHLHGLLFTSWFVLFFIQARLVATRRVSLHRKLGILGAGIAALGTCVALGVAFHAGRRFYYAHPGQFSIETRPLALDWGACAMFALLVTAALLLRRRSDIHKRLMVLASCSILLPAIGRIPALFDAVGLWGLAGCSEILPIICIVYDTIRHRRLHPAFAWGGTAVLLSWPTFLLIGGSNAWLQFAEWLVAR